MSSFRLPKSKSIKRGLEKLISIPSSLSRSSSFKKSKKDAEFDFTFASNECTLVEDEEIQSTFTLTSSEVESTFIGLEPTRTTSDVFSMIKSPREGEWFASSLNPYIKSSTTSRQLNKARRLARISHTQYLETRQENNCLRSKDSFHQQVDQSLQDTLNASFSCDLSSSEDEDSLITQRIQERLAEARLKAKQTHRAYLARCANTSVLDDQKLSEAVHTWLEIPQQSKKTIVTV